jgi:hypothetical protein
MRSQASALAVCLSLTSLPAAAEAESPAAPFSAAQVATAVELRDHAVRGTLAYEFTAELTRAAPARFAGTSAEAAAIAWAEKKLAAWKLPKVWTEPVRVPRWQRGEARGLVLLPNGDTRAVTLAALGGSPGTSSVEGVEAELVEAASVEALEALPDEAVRGRIVFFSTRMERTRDGSGYGRAVAIRGRGVHRAAAKGALAVVIRSVSTAEDAEPHTGSASLDGALPTIPCAALAPRDATALAQDLAAAAGRAVRFRLALTSGLSPDTDSANVLAELPGRERPEEIVLLGCHLDSWDLGEGAEDDAAGCGIVVEALRRLAALPPAKRPRRTVRVVLFANEEFGLSGARAYAAAHAPELARHVLAIEADLGSGKVYGFAARVLAEAEPLVAAITRLLGPLGIEAGPGPARGGADLIPLAAAGVPVADLLHDASLYFDVHHAASDRIGHVSSEGLDQAVAAYLTLAFLIADSSVPLGPVEPPARR